MNYCMIDGSIISLENVRSVQKEERESSNCKKCIYTIIKYTDNTYITIKDDHVKELFSLLNL